MAKHTLCLTSEQKAGTLWVRMALTDAQKSEIYKATGLSPEAIEVPAKASEGPINVVSRNKAQAIHDLVCW
jgi:hypothetical protein